MEEEVRHGAEEEVPIVGVAVDVVCETNSARNRRMMLICLILKVVLLREDEVVLLAVGEEKVCIGVDVGG